MIKLLAFSVIRSGLLGIFCSGAVVVSAAYLDNPALDLSLRRLVEQSPELISVTNAARSFRDNPVWAVEIGLRDGQKRPALLVVAGIEGNDLFSTTICVEWIHYLAAAYRTNEQTKAILDSSSIYVWPRLNPDAARHFFAQPLIETSLTDRPNDDDRDGLTDEDKADDLNGDGVIAWMRVQDPGGEFIADTTEPRLLMKADKLKGERGQWRYLTEGRDDDQDEAWNEDGLGGVNLNRNFPYDYRYFAPGAGLNQVSEPETRALAEFVISHPNIAVVMTYGPNDNLTQTPKSEPPKRPPVTVRPEDIGIYREMGKLYRDTLGLKKELNSPAHGGTFSDWGYYHRGRLSLAAQPWTLALQVELSKPKKEEEKPKKPESAPGKDSGSAKEEAKPADKPEAVAEAGSAAKPPAKPADTRNEAERAGLKWIDENAPEMFLPWKQIEHPDFPGQKVEVGGYRPYALANPPPRFIEPLAVKQGEFLTALLSKLPRLGIRKVAVKTLGNAVYDVMVQVENGGFLPTALSQGETAQEVYPTVVRLALEPAAILSGPRRATVPPLEGSGGMREVRWIIYAPDKQSVELSAVSMLGGSVRTNITLQTP